MPNLALELWDISRDGDAKTLEQVSAKMASLRGKKAEITPAMLHFTQQFYDYVNECKDDIEDPVFLSNLSDRSSYDKKYKYSVLVVDLPENNWEKLFIKSVDIASALGLGIFFNGLLIAFSAKGVVLPKTKKSFWDGFVKHYLQLNIDFPTTVSRFKKITHPIIEAILLKNNFAPHKMAYEEDRLVWSRYVRNMSGGCQDICVGYYHRYGSFFIAMNIEFYFDELSHILDERKIPSAAWSKSFCLKIEDILDIFTEGCSHLITSLNEQRKAIELIENVIVKSILNRINNIYDMDDFINGSLQERLFFPAKNPIYFLIVACLAKNHHFKKIASDIKGKIKNYECFTNELLLWDDLVKYLEEMNIADFLPNRGMIPLSIQLSLKEVVSEYKEKDRHDTWMNENFLNFWLIKDDEILIDFLRSGLVMALSKLLEKVEDESEDQSKDELTKNQKLELEKYPSAYGAIYYIIEFLLYYNIHGISHLVSLSEVEINNLIKSFKILGLEKIGNGYLSAFHRVCDDDFESLGYGQHIIDAFEEVLPFSISQQYIDMVETVRKNYQLFLV